MNRAREGSGSFGVVRHGLTRRVVSRRGMVSSLVVTGMKMSAEAEFIAPIIEIGREQAFTDQEAVWVMCRYLANRCDGARTPDGTGFNKIDSDFGHRVAETPFSALSDRQIWAAQKMLTRYSKTQLATWWSFVTPLPEPGRQQAEESDRKYTEWRQRKEPGWTPPERFRRIEFVEDGGKFFLQMLQNYDSALIERIRMLPQRKYDKTTQTWLVPVHVDTVDAVVSFALDYGYEISAETESSIHAALNEFTERIELSHAADGDYEVKTPDGLELYPFQRIGVEYAEKVKNVLIADQMGLGKTVQGLMTLNVANAFPAVVLCPASLKHNWMREAHKWLPDKTVAILNGNKPQTLQRPDGTPRFDVVIINYDILGGWLADLTALSPKALIADECHALKSPKAQRTKNVKVMIDACPEMRRIFLSGTPVVNRPMEFWTILYLLGYGREMGGLMEYKRRYENAWKSRLEELNQRARTYFMIRRLKPDVLKELPEKQRDMIPIEITNRREYDAAARDVAAYFAQKKIQNEEYHSVKATLLVEAITQGLDGDDGLKWVKERMDAQFGADYNRAYQIASQNEELLRWEALKRLAVEGKMQGVYSWLDEFMETEEKIVVFGLHVDVVERIARRYNAPYIHGGVNINTRQAHVDRFQTDPACRMIVGNLQAMGVGLTLTAASNVAMVEFGWNPSTHDQAEDRCHRIGQKSNVMVWELCAEQTIDEELAQMIQRKREIVDAIQDGAGEATQKELMAELRASLGKRLGQSL